MSVYGHDNVRYFSNMEFPKESFTIAGISHYQTIAKDIVYDDKLNMMAEPENRYDQTAIAIYRNEEKIGYVPKEYYYKQLCKKFMNKPLRVINIKSIRNIRGIRVIPEEFFQEEFIAHSHFADQV